MDPLRCPPQTLLICREAFQWDCPRDTRQSNTPAEPPPPRSPIMGLPQLSCGVFGETTAAGWGIQECDHRADSAPEGPPQG